MNEIEIEMADASRINLPQTHLEIPHKLYVDREISWYEKCLLSELIRLCRFSANVKAESKKKIYCYPTNKYLQVVFNMSKTQIINTLNKLKGLGYINIYHAPNHITRRIYIVNEKCFDHKEEYII